MSSLDSSQKEATITGLYRFAVKGLNADSLSQVAIPQPYDTFPDDRRFALLFDNKAEVWQEILDDNEGQPEWLHKENFLCVFTNPEIMASLDASYRIIPKSQDQDTQRILEIRDRSSGEVVWGPEDLATPEGRTSLGDFFSQDKKVQCITADSPKASEQKFQFGNTSSGWELNEDTRCIHLVSANTVQQVADKCKLPILNPTRFRPNIVVEGWEPWAEFDWIGKTLQVKAGASAMSLKIISKAVRCEGINIDPLDPGTYLDISKLLIEHFPEHGPYLGIYAVIETAGELGVGDKISLVLKDE
eukprot:scaffold3043_cov180-Amphora_coffeaeformis.AAC.18